MAPAKEIKTRLAAVQKVIEAQNGHDDAQDRVNEMLCRTLPSTLGVPAADRHPFNARFVTHIQQTLHTEHARLKNDVAVRDAAFSELLREKAPKEAALVDVQKVAAVKGEAFNKAEQAVNDSVASIKKASAELAKLKRAQGSGDTEITRLVSKKSELELCQNESFLPLLANTAEEESKANKIHAVLKIGAHFGFEKSLLNTAEKVLQMEAGQRGAFDVECFNMIQEAFKNAIAKLDQEIAVLAPASEVRGATVEKGEKGKQELEEEQKETKETLKAAREAKAIADGDVWEADKAMSVFLPELKVLGDSLDASKKALKHFEEGPQKAFNELKDLKEDDFVPKKRYYEKIDGLNCDRAVVDDCREAVAGRGDGRVSLEDARKIFVDIADDNVVTQAERWTLRYCLQEFKWTEAAHDWIVAEVVKVPQAGCPPWKKPRVEGKSYYQVIDGFKCDRGIVDACNEAIAGAGDGRVSYDDAVKVWEKAADGNKVTPTEKWTLRYCMCGFNWTRAGHDFVLEKLHNLGEGGVVV